MRNVIRSAMSRSAPFARTGLVALLLLGVWSCEDLTAPEGIAEGVAPAPGLTPVGEGGPQQVVFSLNTMDVEQLTDIIEVDDGVSGPRWCVTGYWFDPATSSCQARHERNPMGEVELIEGELRIASPDGVRGAPFLWTGSPGRENPFPEEGDFAVDVRLTYEDVQRYGTGAWILTWTPAAPEGTNNPMVQPILRVWADVDNGVRAMLFGTAVQIAGDTVPHWYRVTYEEGAYALFVDGEQVAGPVASERRPNAVWLGSPEFVHRQKHDWSDFRLAEFTVTAPAAVQVIPVTVDVKPDDCGSHIKMKKNGVVPAAIMGEDGVLDVSQIDPATIRFDGVPPLRSAFEDVGTPGSCEGERDGVMDLVLKFDNGLLTEALEGAGAVDGEERTMSVTGNLLEEFGGTPISGQDVVVIRK